MGAEHGGSQSVLIEAFGVSAAIQFNDQSRLNAEEIDDEGADPDLSSPLPAAELTVAQRRPEIAFGAGLAGA